MSDNYFSWYYFEPANLLCIGPGGHEDPRSGWHELEGFPNDSFMVDTVLNQVFALEAHAASVAKRHLIPEDAKIVRQIPYNP